MRGKRVTSWAAVVASLAPFLVSPAFSRPQAAYEPLIQDVYSLRAEKLIPSGEPEEGEVSISPLNGLTLLTARIEAHGEIDPPRGSDFVSIKVNPNGREEVAAFISQDVDESELDHVIVAIHGKLRDGDHYWTTFDRVLEEARDDDVSGSERNVAIIAPQLFSTVYNSGQYSEDQLAWGDLNAWQSGSTATYPENTRLTSFDVLDGIINEFSDSEIYPNVSNITVVGHGGGGQLVQRYAVVGDDPPSHVHVRYVHGDASSSVYFTEDRLIPEDDEDEKITKSFCDLYNSWRYGFEDFPGRNGSSKTPEEYFQQYISRDVVSLVGYKDETGAGDESCMAELQGGKKRRDRNLIYYRYVSELAGTGEDLDGFPGEFEDLPDWSDLANGTFNVRLVVVEDASHDVEELFEGGKGQEILFSDQDLDTGWEMLGQ